MYLINVFKNLSNTKKLFLVGCCVLFLLGLFIRFFRLNQIPLSFYHDEMDYVFTGEAVARWGTDITGEWSPWQLRPLKTLNYTAELPALFHAAAQLAFGFGPQTGHVPAAFFGLLIVISSATLAFFLTKNKVLSTLVGVLVATNPWHIFLSRMGYEAIISLFFQLIFIAMVWLTTSKLTQKPLMRISNYLIMLLSIFLGFFTYHGAKFTFVALIVIACLWLFFQRISKIWKATLIISLIGFLSLLMFHMVQLNQTGALGERDSELLNTEYLTEIVDERRRLSFSSPYTKMMINKPVVAYEALMRRYTSVFDVYRLAVRGAESGFQFSLSVHGYFYLTMIPLSIMGIYWWLKNYPKAGWFLLAFLAVSPIASTVTIGYQTIFRSALTYLLVLIFSGGGATAVCNYLFKSKNSSLGIITIFVILLMEVVAFGSNYLSRYALVSADNHYFFERLLADYESRINEPVLVVVSNEKVYSQARALVSYNQLMPDLTLEERLQFSDPSVSRDFKFKDTTITGSCPNLEEVREVIQVVDQMMFGRCDYKEFLATASASLNDTKQPQRLFAISSPIDSGSYFFLINDPICDPEQVGNFVYVDDIDNYQLQQLCDEEFCQNWIKREF
jgi:hypothetical protein